MTKDVYDYVDIVHHYYPYLSKEEITKVLSYGWFMLDYLIKHNVPIALGPSHGRAFFHKPAGWEADWEIVANERKRSRARYLYSSNKVEFDGTYYFGITDEMFKKIKHKLVTKWRNDPYVLKEMVIYKNREECFGHCSYKHFYSVTYPIDIGWSAKCKDLPMVDLKKIAVRDEKGQINLL